MWKTWFIKLYKNTLSCILRVVHVYFTCSARLLLLAPYHMYRFEPCISKENFNTIEHTTSQERLCQFWLNTFFIAQRTKTGEEDDCSILGEEKQYIVSLSKPELDKINKDKKHKLVPKDFKVQVSNCL